MTKYVIFLFLFFFVAARGQTPLPLPYYLDQPDHILVLGLELEEISGLSFTPDERFLLAIQDEEDIVFYLDPQTGKVCKKVEFWKNGDYEGVEYADSAVYVVKSTGTIYRYPIGQDGERVELEAEKLETPLDGDYNVEGLAYDSARHQLLLACKGKAGKGKEYELKKAIYAYDLQAGALLPEPRYLISLEEVHQFLGTTPLVRKLEKLAEFFDPNNSEFSFSPSALAIHPVTGDLYITSSVGKLLMILSREDGRILHLEKLDKGIFRQPEGICFDRQGNLYIANEGDGGKAKIFRFDMVTE